MLIMKYHDDNDGAICIHTRTRCSLLAHLPDWDMHHHCTSSLCERLISTTCLTFSSLLYCHSFFIIFWSLTGEIQ